MTIIDNITIDKKHKSVLITVPDGSSSIDNVVKISGSNCKKAMKLLLMEKMFG